MIRYIFRDEPITIKNAKSADPQLMGEALAAIKDAAGGDLTPRAVVEAAKDKSHVLHRHFTWDVRKAAEERWLDQARSIIRIVREEDAGAEGGNVRAFISITGKGGVSYRAVADVRKSIDLQKIVLANAERDLLAFETRYRELKDVCQLVVEARERVTARRRGKNESRAAH